MSHMTHHTGIVICAKAATATAASAGRGARRRPFTSVSSPQEKKDHRTKWQPVPLPTAPPSFLGRIPFQMILLAMTVFLLSSIAAVDAAKTVNPRDPTVQFFTQAVDHANQQNTDTFLQRFWTQNAWWNPTPGKGKPLVILQPTSFADPNELVNSAVATWAEKLGASLIQIESRYTGQSFPEKGLNTSSLQYDTVDQHIQDLVSFIANRTTVLGLDQLQARWILVGSFFEGAYTTWFRSKYPSLAFGSVSVSPYLVAVAENQDYDKAYQDYVGPTCASAIHDVVYSVANSFNTYTPAQKLSYEAKSGCGGANFTDDAEFFYVMAMLLMGNLYQPLVCSNITAASSFSQDAKMANLANLMQSLFSQSGAPCAGWNIAKDVGSQGFRSTFYLMCAQLGQFETAPTTGNALIAPPVNRNWYLKVCKKLFNNNLPPEPNVALFNAAHGGNNPPGCNMVFVSSPNDPYRALGPDASLITRASPTNKAISVQCNEPLVGLSVLAAPSGSDKPCVVFARNQIFSILQKWQTDPVACPVPHGGDGNDDTTTAVVGTVVAVFGVLVGIVIGGVAVFYLMRYAYHNAKRYAWTKLN